MEIARWEAQIAIAQFAIKVQKKKEFKEGELRDNRKTKAFLPLFFG